MSTSPSVSESSASTSTSEFPASEASVSLPIPEPPASPIIRQASTSPSISEHPTSPTTSSAFASSPIRGASTSPPISDYAFIHETSSSLYSTSPTISSSSITPPLPSPTDSFSPPWTSLPSISPTSSSISFSSSWASSSSSSASTSTNPISPSYIPSPPPAPPPNYILEITLCPHLISNPRISRTLSLPAHTSFATLHAAIQLSFNWSSLHPWYFSIDNEESDPDDHNDSSPYNDNHNNNTNPPKKPPLLHLLPTPLYPLSLYPSLPPHTHYAHSTPLSTIYTSPHLASAPLTYTYDPQHARWTHAITLVGLSSPPPPASVAPIHSSPRITCLHGTGRAPPETCHGPATWEYLKRAYGKREMERRWGMKGLVTEEEEGWMGWFEREGGGGGEGGSRMGKRGGGGMRAEEWDIGLVRRGLQGLGEEGWVRV